MTELNLSTYPAAEAASQANKWHWYHLLPLAALAFFMFTPTIVWKLRLPGPIERVGDLLILTMIALAVVRMLTTDHIPGFFVAILGVAIISTVVAFFEGQALTATLWGIWMFFRFPMVGVYVYMVPNWPDGLPRLIPKALLALLVIHVIAQMFFFALGTPAGDMLGGMLGARGTGALLLVLMMVLAISLGQWIVKRDWRMVAAVLLLGAISSSLGEMKFFVFAMPVMAGMAVAIQLLQRGQVRRSLLFAVGMVIAMVLFVAAYNTIVVGNGYANVPLQEFLLEEDTRSNYLSRDASRGNNTYTLYRGDAFGYAWNTIQRDLPTTLFGMGIGTTQYNPGLGIVGAGFRQGRYGLLSGQTSLFNVMSELGLMGLLLVFLLIAYTVVVMFRSMYKDHNPDLDVLRYGVLLFTLMWPLWIWYNSSLILPAPMLLYWMLWGYVLQQSIRPFPIWSRPVGVSNAS